MIRAYKYLFYKLCLFERVLFDPIPGFTAFCFLIVLQSLNVFCLFIIVDRFYPITLPLRWSYQNVLCGFALLAVPQYFFFLHRGRFRRVIGEFAHESERQSLIGGLVVGVYIVLSFLLIFVAASIPSRHI
jgi:hypothetical protein